jgi:hypothetical protein
MDLTTARILTAALILLNDQPRFAPRNRRLSIDSYSVAEGIQVLLNSKGWDWQDPQLQPHTN